MLTGFRFTNFKSWNDTGPVRLAPLTVLFGRNSSGKSSLLQAELLMKQTAESLDPRQVLNLGGDDAYTDLGTYQDMVRDHDTQLRVSMSLTGACRNPSRFGRFRPDLSSPPALGFGLRWARNAKGCSLANWWSIRWTTGLTLMVDGV